MPTPIYGLVIPAADAPVDVAQDLTKLATSVENTLVAQDINDTGWVVFPITDAKLGVYGAGLEPRYRVKNGVCTITGALVVNTANALDAGVTWATLPVQARPDYGLTTVQQSSGTSRWAMAIRTNGQLSAERFGPGTGQTVGTWLPFTATWVVG